jgi:hypothetical protein
VKAPKSARRARRAEATVWVPSRPRSRPWLCARSRSSSAFSLAAAGAADSVGFVFLWGSDADESHFLRARRKGAMALDGIRMPDGCYADGTWELSVHVTDLNRDVTLRVTGEVHIGGVMLKLVEKLGE